MTRNFGSPIFHWLRDEKIFPDVATLKSQIAEDSARARIVLG